MSDLNNTQASDNAVRPLLEKIAAREAALDILSEKALERAESNDFAFKRLLIEFKAADLVSDEDDLRKNIELYKSQGMDEPDRLCFRNNLADYETTMRALEHHELI